MGDGIMKNLEKENVLTDYGEISADVARNLEKNMDIKLPEEYVRFITKHNGAHLNFFDVFDYYDESKQIDSVDSIAFKSLEDIEDSIQGLLRESIDDPEYFYEKLIPFGDNGGGDLICFDYRNYDGDNPPIIIWAHGAPENSKRISFIANSFEEFINMLHEPEKSRL
jgi:hypothetical protein